MPLLGPCRQGWMLFRETMGSSCRPHQASRLVVLGTLLAVASPLRAQSVTIWPAPAVVRADALGQVRFSLVVHNSGPEVARGVVVRDQVEAGGTLVTSTPDAQPDGEAWSWSLGDLWPGESARIELTIEDGVDLGAEVRAVQGTARQAVAPALRLATHDPSLDLYLEPTLDADAADPEVLSAVAELAGDPDRIIARVSRDVQYEAYRGSLRGARGTLWSEAGNAWDQASLLVAMLRAVGLPARYARAGVDDATAAALIRSMFRPRNNMLAPVRDPEFLLDQLLDPAVVEATWPGLGMDTFIPQDRQALRDLLFADPATDAELLLVARDHVWVQVERGSGWVDVDPCLGTAPGSPTSTFAAIDDALRHHVDVALTVELFNPMFGMAATDVKQPLSARFSSVQLVGRLLALQHLVHSNSMQGLVFGSNLHTYTPQLTIDGQVVLEGEAYQEHTTSFPGGNQLITGAFADVTVTSPSGTVQHVHHTIADRLGASVRLGGEEDVSLQLDANEPLAALGPLDVVGIQVASSWQAPHAAARWLGSTQRHREQLQARSDIIASLSALGDGAALDPAQSAQLADLQDLGRRAQHALVGSIGARYLDLSSRLAQRAQDFMLVRAYPARPRVVVVRARGTSQGPAPVVDLAANELQVVAPDDIPASAAMIFRMARGFIEANLEGEVLRLVDDAHVISARALFAAAEEQGVLIRSIHASNWLDLYLLPIDDGVRAGVRAAIARGMQVLLPEQPVMLNGVAAMVWLEFDLATGDVQAVDANGWHSAAVEYSFLDKVLTKGLGVWFGGMAGFSAGTLQGLAKVLDSTLTKFDPVSTGMNLGLALGGATGSQAGAAAAAAGAAQGDLSSLIFALLAAAAPTPGVEEFIGGFDLGQSLGKTVGEARVQIMALGIDPPLPDFNAGTSGPLRRPLSVDHLTLSAQVAALPELPAQASGTMLHVAGTLSLRAASGLRVHVPVAWGQGELSAQGQLFEDGLQIRDGVVRGMAHEIFCPGSVAALGQGALLRTDSLTTGRLATFTASCSGSIEFDGVLEGESAPGHFLLLATAAELGAAEAWVQTSTLEVDVDGATVQLGARGFAGVQGTLGTALGAPLAASSSSSLLLSLPEVLHLQAGPNTLPLPQVLAREAAQVELWVEAPTGWRVDLDDSALVLTPSREASGQVQHIQVWARDKASGTQVGQAMEAYRDLPATPLVVRLAHEPLFTTLVDGVPLPTVFMAQVDNLGDQIASVDLVASGTAGVDFVLGNDRLELAPGERGTVAIAARPQLPLPTPGADLTLTLDASTGAAQAQGSASIPFPAVLGVTLTMDPDRALRVSGETLDATLTITAKGNAIRDVHLASSTARHMPLLGLPRVLSLAPGEVRRIPLQTSLTPDAGPGLVHGVVIEARDGEVVLGYSRVQLEAVGAETDRLLELIDLARSLGETRVATVLEGTADPYHRLYLRCQPKDVYALSQDLRTLASALWDPVFDDVRVQLRALANAMLVSGYTCADLDLAAVELQFGRIAAILNTLGAHDFRIAIDPDGALAIPGGDVAFALRLERLGSAPTTLHLSVDGIAANVASPVTPDPLIDALPLTVHVPGPGTFSFTVTATVDGAPELSRRATSTVVANGEWVQVVGLGSLPAFAIPGARLRMFADLFNPLNAPQDMLAFLTLSRPDGSTVYQSVSPTPIHLPVSQALHRFELDRVQTFDEADGVFTLAIALERTDGQGPVPGGQASRSLSLGQPLRAVTRVNPSLLPPGDPVITAAIDVERRPLNVLPGVGNPVEIRLIAADAEGPNGLAADAAGNVYFSSFGTQRSSTSAGFVPGFTVHRISPLLAVTQLAEVGSSPTGLTVGPDGALYAVNAGNPELVSRVDLSDESVSVYYDFRNTVDTIVGENPISMVFDDAGVLYATEYYDPFIFGIIYPGKWVYALQPDGDLDGRSDLAEVFMAGFEYPTCITIDRRTQDLVVCDTGHRSLVSLNTMGTPTNVTLLSDVHVAGVMFDETGNLYTLDAETGDIRVWPTDISSGRTELVGEGTWLMGGFLAPINLVADADGNLWTTHFEEDHVIRVTMVPSIAPPSLDLTLTHGTLGGGVDTTSALPVVGPWPTYSSGTLTWLLPFEATATAQHFEYAQQLTGLQPGSVVPLSSGSTLELQQGVDRTTLALDSLIAVVDHLVSLSPDLVDLERGAGHTVKVTLRNHRDQPDTVDLAVVGLDPSIRAEIPTQVTVPAQGSITVDLVLFSSDFTPDGLQRYQIVASSVLAGNDAVVGTARVHGYRIVATPDPVEIRGRNGEQVSFSVLYTRQAGDTRRAFYTRTQGLADITSTHQERLGLVDFYMTDGNRLVSYTFTLRGPAGRYPVGVEISELVAPYRYDLVAAVIVTIIDDDSVEVVADPPVVRSGRTVPFTLTAVIRNTGMTTRTVTLSRCCGPAYWGPVFNAGPHVLGPGAEKRVPIRMSPNGILVGDYIHTLKVTDVDNNLITDSFDAHVILETPGAKLRILDPRSVVSSTGEAQFTVRVDRVVFDPPGMMDLAVTGPLAFSASLARTHVDLTSVTRVDVPLHVEGLSGLTQGPWPVTVLGWPPDDPTLVFSDTGLVTVAVSGVYGHFSPATLAGRHSETFTAMLVLDNLDFSAGTGVQVALASSDTSLHVTPQSAALSLAAGGQAAIPLQLTVDAPGLYELVATVSPSIEAPFELRLPLDVVLNHSPTAPTLLVPVAGAHTGARPGLSFSAASDDDGDALTYACEVDDGVGGVANLSSPLTSMVVGPLAPGAYFWRCRAWDGYVWGPWSGDESFVVDLALDNHPPEAPVIQSPQDQAQDLSLPLNLEWEQSLDLDGDLLSYQVQVATDDQFVGLIHDVDQIPMGGSATVQHAVPELVTGQNYHARVRAADLYGTSPWALVQFTTAAPVPDAGVDAGGQSPDGAVADVPLLDAGAVDTVVADGASTFTDAFGLDAPALDGTLATDAALDAGAADVVLDDGGRVDTGSGETGVDTGAAIGADGSGTATGQGDASGKSPTAAEGCGCASTGRSVPLAVLGLGLSLLVWRRRRRAGTVPSGEE
ncbi:MAG: transglutaminase domain-containing protein [Pseudomonadota bacterium]